MCVFAMAAVCAFSEANGRFPRAGQMKMGTVKSVDASAGKFVIVDADDAEISVSVNPKTMIFKSVKANRAENASAASVEKREKNDDGEQTRPSKNFNGSGKKFQNPQTAKAFRHRPQNLSRVAAMEFSDIKEGDWVSVASFLTGTKTLEARKIEVFSK